MNVPSAAKVSVPCADCVPTDAVSASPSASPSSSEAESVSPSSTEKAVFPAVGFWFCTTVTFTVPVAEAPAASVTV